LGEEVKQISYKEKGSRMPNRMCGHGGRIVGIVGVSEGRWREKERAM
jgi:hypothetical protein